MKKPSTPALRRELLTILTTLRSGFSKMWPKQRRRAKRRLRSSYRELKAQILAVEEEARVLASVLASRTASARFSPKMKPWELRSNVRQMQSQKVSSYGVRRAAQILGRIVSRESEEPAEKSKGASA
jgi:hypothetical protein